MEELDILSVIIGQVISGRISMAEITTVNRAFII